MDKENSDFKMNTMEFRGYVTRALEDICNNVNEVKKDVRTNTKIINKLQLRVAGVAATVALLVTIVCMILKDVLFNGGQ